jgi:hypothetical protein
MQKTKEQNQCNNCKWSIFFPQGTLDSATGKPTKHDEIYCCELNKIFPKSKPPYRFFCASFKKKREVGV